MDGDQFKKIFRGLQVDTQYRVTIFGRLFRQEKLYETSVSFAIGTTGERLVEEPNAFDNADISCPDFTWGSNSAPLLVFLL